jgi:hypothetical protein
MKHFFISILLLTFSSTSFAVTFPKIYKSFGSDFQATLVIAAHGKDEQYLIRFNGFEDSIDGKTLLYKKGWKRKNPNRGEYYQLVGAKIINFRNDDKQTLIYGTITPYSEVYLGNKKAVKMIYSDKGTPQLYEKMITQYRETQGIMPSKLKTKKTIEQAGKDFTKACKQTIKINVDWSAFTSKNQKTTPGMVKAYVSAMTKLCNKDTDYLDALKKITELNVVPSNTKGKDKIAINGTIMSLAIDQDAPNVSETSYRKLLDIL